MQIYTKGFNWVNVPNAVTNQYKAVKSPRVTIFATTTGERLAEALTGSQADSGSYNRFIMFVGNPDRIEKRYSGLKWEPDKSLMDLIEWVITLQPDTPMPLNNAAFDYFVKFDSEVIEPLKFDDPQLAGRLSEQALKLAGLIALGSRRTEVIEEDLRQAYNIRLCLYHRAKAYLDSEGGLNGEDPTVVAFNQIVELIKKHRRMPLSQLAKYSRKYKGLQIWQRDKVLQHLERIGIAHVEEVKKGKVLINSEDKK
jgi:hypothetical protein